MDIGRAHFYLVYCFVFNSYTVIVAFHLPAYLITCSDNSRYAKGNVFYCCLLLYTRNQQRSQHYGFILGFGESHVLKNMWKRWSVASAVASREPVGCIRNGYSLIRQVTRLSKRILEALRSGSLLLCVPSFRARVLLLLGYKRQTKKHNLLRCLLSPLKAFVSRNFCIYQNGCLTSSLPLCGLNMTRYTVPPTSYNNKPPTKNEFVAVFELR